MSQTEHIHVKGARLHNLQNIEIKIPRNRYIVITGLSGSGKSTLAFDTIFAEGQRRYAESLSAYTRQFLGRISKPDVDFITGIPPAIAIEQKVNTRNPRSTVGTSTEIYDYLKLLYARIGHTVSPVSGKEVKRHNAIDVINFITAQQAGSRLYILSPIVMKEKTGWIETLTLLQNEGFTRLEADGKEYRVEEILPAIEKYSNKTFRLLIDRVTASCEEDATARISDSVQIAMEKGNGVCMIESPDGTIKQTFSTHFEADGITFEEPAEHLFSFNSPVGACPRCEGYGHIIGIDENLVIPDHSLSIYNDAIACWRGEIMKEYKEQLIRVADKVKIPIHKPFYELTDTQKQTLWNEKEKFTGLHSFFDMLDTQRSKIHHRVMLTRYMGKTICPFCRGTRLRKEANYVRVSGKTISELVVMPVNALLEFMQHLTLNHYEQKVASRTLIEIRNRLQYMIDVGLGYLTLNRLSKTLSGGESQRINLATSLGSSLVGSLYILDEPSIGMHPRDTQQLIKVLEQLRDLGNTVVVVEHDEEIIRAADMIIDIGPLAGQHGGKIVFQGRLEEADNKASPIDDSLTLAYLQGREKIETPKQRRKLQNYIEIKGARENNLRNIDVRFPLEGLVAVTGVSGSGKSSLVKGILYPALNEAINQRGERPVNFNTLQGDLKRITQVEMIDQHSIGRSSRSNPVTYIKAYDEIRRLFSHQPYAKLNGYGYSHFSFNIEGGRCEECQGEGFVKVEMQFMADVTLLCETCGGKRFKPDILEVRYKGYNISDVLDLTVNRAIDFFAAQKEITAMKIANKLKPLQDVGLGYIRLGQASSTLSGGESQRIKLASFLGKGTADSTILFIFDEPTTGLHFHDVKRLLEIFNHLVSCGHSIVVVEHNMDVIKCADWIIDLGPEAGEHGGQVLFAGTPEDLARNKDSRTGKYLLNKLRIASPQSCPKDTPP